MVEVVLRPVDDVWRGRGRVAEPIPQAVFDALKGTYNTDKAGVVIIRSEQDKKEALELIAMMRRAARQLGRRVAIQPAVDRITTEFRFRLVDKVGR